MVRFNRKSERGFTLVELLIVIAIIGVLSTIGIPAFKRMVQKSKKTEAKTNLGGVYTAEQAFFSEYGGYGNNLERVGFNIDGTNNNLIYSVGFFNATCAAAVQAIKPDQTGPVGAGINTAYPQYYTGALDPTAGVDSLYHTSKAFTRQTNGSSGGVELTVCAPSIALTTYLLKDGGTVPAAIGVFPYAPTGGTVGDANGYLAGAVGVIAANASKTAPNAGEIDYWTIDHERNLRNTQDGTR